MDSEFFYNRFLKNLPLIKKLRGRKKLASFMVLHSWRQKDFATTARKVIEALSKLPEGITCRYSWVAASQDSAYCIYEANADKGAVIADFLRNAVPEMTSEVKQVLMFAPPSQDLYMIMHSLIPK
jgi:hypothetical protein